MAQQMRSPKRLLKKAFFYVIIRPLRPLADAVAETRFRGFAFGLYHVYGYYMPKDGD